MFLMFFWFYFTTTGFSDFPQTLRAYSGLRTLALTFPLKPLLPDSLLDNSLLQGSFTSFLSLCKCPPSIPSLKNTDTEAIRPIVPTPLP